MASYCKVKYPRVIIFLLLTITTNQKCFAKELQNRTSANAGTEEVPTEEQRLFSHQNIDIFTKMVAKLVTDLKVELKNISVTIEKCQKKLHGTNDNESPVILPSAENDEVTLNSLLYAESAPWSACRRSCKTSRIRKCRIENLCEMDVFVEEAYCYIPGTRCEEKVKQIFENRQTTNNNNDKNNDNHDHHGNDEEIDHHDNDEENSDDSHNTDMFFEDDYSSSHDHDNSHDDDEDLYMLGDNFFNIFDSSDMEDDDGHSYHDSSPPDEYDPEHPEGEDEPDAAVPFAFPPECGKSSISAPQKLFRIIGGGEAIKGSWPWQVAVLNKFKDNFCGGTLIASNWVLTAAHCIRKKLFVRIDEHDLATADGEIELKVLKSFKHPNYNMKTINNDIALLKIPDFPRSRKAPVAKVACLPGAKERLPSKKSCVVLGWGKQGENHLFGSDILRYAKVPIVGQKTCEKVYRSHGITKNMFCAGALKGGLDTCEGDSGGPLLCQNDAQNWVLQGVTSFGEGCGERNRVGVYVKVANYVQWINKTLAQN